ncbi:DUF389 domain-containing protein [Streptomyces sp. NPDC006879]|uniref:DUF389 domain-containing protein n=1 Tax=Streptomyces sp. NPDC006879 TaxID=3364767 RepID=UPI0036B6F0AC
MISGLRDRILPAAQCRSMYDLVQDLDLSAGDATAKRSAFWTMLTLSSVIAAGGVITDSTATVIGAMIIAPLSTPIMGIALGSVQRQRTGAGLYVLFGCLLVVGIGTAFSAVLPQNYDLLSNSQISGRTSPGLLDLVSALATGLAGAVALGRRDVAAVLPGVAIAISLVPPLVVTGVCLGHLAWWLALGALVLFLSNLFALVFAGMVIFAALGYRSGITEPIRHSARRTYIALALLFAAVFVPLAANTAFALLLNTWTARVKVAAEQWLSADPGASVTSVDVVSRTIYVHVRTPGDLPPLNTLLSDLEGQVPDGIPIVVDATRGRRIDAGRVGDKDGQSGSLPAGTVGSQLDPGGS